MLILINWQRRQLSQHVALCDIYQGQTPSQNCVPAHLFVRGSIHFQQPAQPGNNFNWRRLKSPTKKSFRNLWLTCNYVKNWIFGNKPLQKKQGWKSKCQNMQLMWPALLVSRLLSFRYFSWGSIFKVLLPSLRPFLTASYNQRWQIQGEKQCTGWCKPTTRQRGSK